MIGVYRLLLYETQRERGKNGWGIVLFASQRVSFAGGSTIHGTIDGGRDFEQEKLIPRHKYALTPALHLITQ